MNLNLTGPRRWRLHEPAPPRRRRRGRQSAHAPREGAAVVSRRCRSHAGRAAAARSREPNGELHGTVLVRAAPRAALHVRPRVEINSRRAISAAMLQTRPRPPRDTLDRIQRTAPHATLERPRIEAQVELCLPHGLEPHEVTGVDGVVGGRPARVDASRGLLFEPGLGSVRDAAEEGPVRAAQEFYC